MFQVSEQAKEELRSRLNAAGAPKLIRLKMRQSCFMKLKLTLEDKIQPNDTEVRLDGMDFIIDTDQVHYFRDKSIDFIPDVTGFKQFEVVSDLHRPY